MDLLRSKTGRVLIESHRGVQDGLPENSWPAIEAAKAQGADLIEVDVQMSADGVLYLRHNYQIPDGRLGSQVSWGEIQAATAEAYPLLEDVLFWAKRESLRFSLDLKTAFTQPGELAKQALKLVQQSGTVEQVILMGWDHEELLVLKKKQPQFTTRAFITGRPVDLVGVVQAAQADAVSLVYGIAAPKDAERLHAAGIAVALAGLWEFDPTLVDEFGADIVVWGKPGEARRALERAGR
jgi:glycerophosphoryl diester phosphodiesterase